MKRKILLVLTLALFVAGSVSFAAASNARVMDLECHFNNIKIIKNGQPLKVTREPFIYDGSTFLPLRDLTESFGYNVKWDGATNTITLTGGETGDTALLEQDLRNKDIIIQQLQAQVRSLQNENNDLKKELDDYDDDDDDDDDDDEDLDDLKDDLEDDYEDYTQGDEDLEFGFDIDESRSKISITMEGDFERKSSEWEDRDEDEFQDYIEDIAKDVADEMDKDVEIEVEDEDGKTVGEYTYDEGKGRFKVEEEYGSDDDDDDDSDYEDDIKDMLEDDYEDYTQGDEDLEFEYRVNVKDDEVEVTMILQDYEEDDDEWEDRDEDEFEDFMEDIAKDVARIKEDSDVEIEVYSEKDSSSRILSESYDADDID